MNKSLENHPYFPAQLFLFAATFWLLFAIIEALFIGGEFGITIGGTYFGGNYNVFLMDECFLLLFLSGIYALFHFLTKNKPLILRWVYVHFFLTIILFLVINLIAFLELSPFLGLLIPAVLLIGMAQIIPFLNITISLLKNR